jgi:hypothetical protein
MAVDIIMFARNHLRADRVKLMSGRKRKISIGSGQRSFERSMQKAAGLDHDHASGAAIRMAIGQPKEGHGHGLSVLGGGPGERE